MINISTQPFHDRQYFSLDEWLLWQESFHYTAIELGLDRCMTVATNLGLLKPEHHIISIAGTNGKGSSAKMLSSILTHAGYKVGCYTSPHIINYNERIQIDGIEIDDTTLCNSFARIDRARGNISLTYFEFGTLAAMDIFRDSSVDIAILEVGLGGRLDAVNCFDADVALVTSIDLDHQNWLGKDRESIAREKAGILRASAPAICSDFDPPVSLLGYAEKLNTRIYTGGEDFNYKINGDKWFWWSDKNQFDVLPTPSLYNEAQIQNASGVLMVLETLADRFPVGNEAIVRGLAEFKLNGRFQIVPDTAQIILDVAHNCESARNLVTNLQKIPVNGTTYLLIGMLKDKDHYSVFTQLETIADFWHIVPLDAPRGTEANSLGKVLSAMHVEDRTSVHQSIPDALDNIRSIVNPDDRIVITGSFLTVAAAIKYLGLKA